MTIKLAWIGLLAIAVLAGCGAMDGDEDIAEVSAATATNVYRIAGATCGVVINPDSMHTVQLKYDLTSEPDDAPA